MEKQCFVAVKKRHGALKQVRVEIGPFFANNERPRLAAPTGFLIVVRLDLGWINTWMRSPAIRHGVSLFIISRFILHSFALIFQFGENGRCFSPQLFVDHHYPQTNGLPATFELQNVRGDGDCIFLAATWLSNVDGVRIRVCNIFREGTEILAVTPESKASAAALLQKAAFEMNCSREEYLEKLQTPGRLGGLYGGTVVTSCMKCLCSNTTYNGVRRRT